MARIEVYNRKIVPFDRSSENDWELFDKRGQQKIDLISNSFEVLGDLVGMVTKGQLKGEKLVSFGGWKDGIWIKGLLSPSTGLFYKIEGWKN